MISETVTLDECNVLPRISDAVSPGLNGRFGWNMILNGQAKQSAVAQFGKPFQIFEEGILSIFKLRATQHPLHGNGCIRITDDTRFTHSFRSRAVLEKSLCKGYEKSSWRSTIISNEGKREQGTEDHHWYGHQPK